MPYTQEQIDTMFAELPGDVKDAMSAVDTVHVLADIQKKYSLHIDQAGELSTDAALLMVGAIKPQEFIGQIETNLRIPHETAKLIAAEVNEKIFRPVRDSLMQIHKMKEGGRGKESAPVVDIPTAPLGSIPGEYGIKDNMKNNTEETQPVRTETKAPVAPDPYREAVK